MIELHQRLVMQEGQAARTPVHRCQYRPVHQGPVGVDEPGLGPGDQPAQQTLEEDSAEEHRRAATPDHRRTAVRCAVPCLHTGPDQTHEDHQGQTEMGRQPLGGDIDPLGQAAGHHPPADQALQPTEGQQDGAAPDQPLRNLAQDQENSERKGKSRADHPPQQPMGPFPPEDFLELSQAHAGVDLGVLRNGTVFLESLLPVGRVHRRQSPHDRLPLGDRQA